MVNYYCFVLLLLFFAHNFKLFSRPQSQMESSSWLTVRCIYAEGELLSNWRTFTLTLWLHMWSVKVELRVIIFLQVNISVKTIRKLYVIFFNV